jgi:hypothetical protein
MSLVNPFLTLEEPWTRVQEWACASLKAAGFTVIKTFDLQVARGTGSPCPYHGLHPCDCQMVILWIGCNADHRVSLVIHGWDKRTSLSLTAFSEKGEDPSLLTTIQQVLMAALSNIGERN